MSLAFPKPTPIAKERRRLRRGKPPARSSKRIRCRTTLGAKRRAAKAAGGVDPDTWVAICHFYRDLSGVVRCAYACGRPAQEQDHVRPISRGGKHVATNVVPVCSDCNARKGTRTWEPRKRHQFMEKEATPTKE